MERVRGELDNSIFTDNKSCQRCVVLNFFFESPVHLQASGSLLSLLGMLIMAYYDKMNYNCRMSSHALQQAAGRPNAWPF